MKVRFTKMHALGNDFIVIDDRDGGLKRITRIATRLCDRKFGIGADQLLLLCNSKIADFRMRIFNADGSEVEMCGNGIRCLGKYILDDIMLCEESSFARKYCETIDTLTIETMAGIKHIYQSGNLFRVDMGEPEFEAAKIPVAVKYVKDSLKKGKVMNYPLKAGNRTYKITCVSMGNPHAVVVVRDITSVPLDRIGPLIENHVLFPNRTNVEFIQAASRSALKMRVWERGAGETLACGTGASAAVVASSLLGLTGRKVNVSLPGGKLLIHWSEKDNHVYMTGPAVTVFEGTIEI